MILCQEFLSSAESRERAARLRAEQDEARQREIAAAAEAEAARLRAEEEAQQRTAAAAEAEAVEFRWLQQRLVDRKVDPAVAFPAAMLLHQADITSEEELAELTVDDFKTLLDLVITPKVFEARAIMLRTRLTAIHQDVKVRVQNKFIHLKIFVLIHRVHF